MTTRRAFLSAVAAAGGFAVGYRLEAAVRDFPLNAWLRISSDDVVTLIASQSEMGQGVMTTLPAVLAEELGADWRRVHIETSGVNPSYNNPRINWQFTGNSESTTGFFELLRTMGASARQMLIGAAAARWSVPVAECTTKAGLVIHTPSRRTLRFGDVAEEASRIVPPRDVTFKDPSQWTLLGRAQPRVELPDKLCGRAVFGLDFAVDGLVHAAVKQCPVFGGTLRSFDKSSVAGLSGVLDVVPVPHGVAVVAQQYWQASRALKALKLEWDYGPNTTASSSSLAAQYREALAGGDWNTVCAEGPALRETQMGGRYEAVYTQEYESQYLAHATMEPMNCTVHVTDGQCTVWGPLQGNALARLVLAQMLNIPAERVTVNRTLLGGGFGRRLLVDFVVQAALVSKAVGRPVKVVWSREEDLAQDAYRPATLQRITAGLDANGYPRAVAHKVVSPSILQFVFGQAVTANNDPSCLEGLMETHYDLASQRVDFHLLKVGVPTSVLRTTGYGPNIFAVESFIDELAHKAGRDPLAFRRELLKDERSRRVLDVLAEKCQWHKHPPAGVARGVAYTEAFRTHIAHAVELSVKDRVVHIHQVHCVIDCGVALDPDICRNSIEGGTIWGLGAAFLSEMHFRDGRAVESNFHNYRIPAMSDAPPVAVHIVNSSLKELGGTGEVGPVTMVPALANAIYAATGVRCRTLPLSKAGFRLA